MEIDLSFQFPPTRPSGGSGPEVGLKLHIPFPEQRPHAVLNFLYMCTGELPSREMMDTFHRLSLALSSSSSSSSSLSATSSWTPVFNSTMCYQSVAEAIADDFPPFPHTAVMHVDLGEPKVMELGKSTTKNIFTRGGFLPDEPLSLPPPSESNAAAHILVSQMQQLRAGTLLCGAIPGVPHTQGSRYYLLLEDVGASCLQKGVDWKNFPPLGIIATHPSQVHGGTNGTGLSRLLEALKKVPLHPRTLAPQKKIELASSSIQWAPTPSPSSLSSSPPAPPPSPLPSASASSSTLSSPTPFPRTAGRVRRRDEEEEDQEHGRGHRGIGEESGEDSGMNHNNNGGGGHRSFFHIQKRFPTAASRLGGVGTSRTFIQGEQMKKRRRLEGWGEEKDLSMDSADKMVSVDEVGDANEPFDFFKLQERVFGLDLEEVKNKQNEALQRKMRRLSKQKAFSHAYHSKVEKKRRMKEIVLEKINPSGGGPAGGEEDGAPKSRGGKRLRRKY